MKRNVFLWFLGFVIIVCAFVFTSQLQVVEASRQNYYAQNNTATTTAVTATYQDLVTLSFTPDANSTYMVLGSWEIRPQSFGWVRSRFINTTSSAVLGSHRQRGTNIWQSYGMPEFLVTGGSPTSQTYALQYRSDEASITAEAKSARIFALKLTNEDKYAVALSDVSDSTSTPTAPLDAVTLTFTPPSSGDYLIMAFFEYEIPSGSGHFGTGQLLINTATSGIISKSSSTGIGALHIYSYSQVATLGATSQTIKAQFHRSASASVTYTVRNARIIALRLDEFANVYYTQDLNNATTTSTSYVNRLTMTETVRAENHFLVMAGVANTEGTNRQVEYQFTDASVEINAMNHGTFSSGRTHGPFAIYHDTYSAGSRTWETNMRRQGAGSDSSVVGVSDTSIVVMDLGAGDIPPPPDPSDTSAKIVINGGRMKINGGKVVLNGSRETTCIPSTGTFGYDTAGGSTGNFPISSIQSTRFEAPANGMITTITARFNKQTAGSTDVKALVYADNAGAPGALLGESNVTSATNSLAWYEFTGLSVPVTQGNFYWLTTYNDDEISIRFDSGATNQFAQRTSGITYPTTPDPFGTPTYFDARYSIWATYEYGC